MTICNAMADLLKHAPLTRATCQLQSWSNNVGFCRKLSKLGALGPSPLGTVGVADPLKHTHSLYMLLRFCIVATSGVLAW